jgi:hypothetical protein
MDNKELQNGLSSVNIVINYKIVGESSYGHETRVEEIRNFYNLTFVSSSASRPPTGHTLSALYHKLYRTV